MGWGDPAREASPADAPAALQGSAGLTGPPGPSNPQEAVQRLGQPDVMLTIEGEAEPAGSKSAFVPTKRGTKEPIRRAGGSIMVNVVDANKAKLEPWKKLVAFEAKQQLGSGFLILDCPLRVEFDFYVERPGGQYGAKGTVLPSAPARPAVVPDVLKLARGVEDALTDVLWVNDSRIVEEELRKMYGRARVEVRVWRLLEAVTPDGQETLLD